jgi:PilX N-terminal
MSERGVALILVLLVMLTLSALAMSLAVMVSTESQVTASYRDGIETFYGAQAALERVLPDLAAESDFTRVLTGVSVSSFIDGPAGPRRLPDGTFTDLLALTSMLNCGSAVCSDADLDEAREDRPWGRSNPRWQLYGHGPSTALGAGQLGEARVYVVVWVADDPSETDMDPFTDGGGEGNPGRGRLSITAHGYGPAGARRVIEATVANSDQGFNVLSWREIR